MKAIPSRLWLAGALALLVLTAAACSTGPSSSTASTGASNGTSGGAGQHSASSGSGPSSGTPAGSSQPKASGGSGSSGSGGSGSSGSGKSGSSGSGGSGSSGSKPEAGATNETLPSVSDQFKADVSSFNSAANSAQQAVGQLPSNASAQEVAPTVAPLMTAATTLQAHLVNLQWPAAAQPDAQNLNENLGKLTAVIDEARLSIGFDSTKQFRSQLSSAIGAVDGAVSSVSAQIT